MYDEKRVLHKKTITWCWCPMTFNRLQWSIRWLWWVFGWKLRSVRQFWGRNMARIRFLPWSDSSIVVDTLDCCKIYGNTPYIWTIVLAMRLTPVIDNGNWAIKMWCVSVTYFSLFQIIKVDKSKHKRGTNPRHRKKESQNIYSNKTSVRQ